MLNLGTGGSALDATLGSTTGADTNDPTLLAWSGVNYLYLPGVTGNFASTPDSNALDITGDIELELIWDTAPDWSTNATQNGVFIGKDEAVGQRSYGLRQITGTKRVEFFSSNDGTTTTLRSFASDIPVGTNAIKVTLDVDNGATQNVATLFTSTNQGASYAQLGAAIVNAGVTSIFASTSAVTIGQSAVSGSVSIPQSLRRAIIRNGIGGTTVFDADFTRGITSGAQTSFTESSSNAATVTINRATSGRKAVAVVRNVLLLGTDDYLAGPNNALLKFGASQDFTMLVVGRLWDVSSSTYMSLIGNRENIPTTSPTGVELGLNFPIAGQSAGTIGIVTTPYNANTMAGVAGRLDVIGVQRDVSGGRNFRNNALSPYVNPAGYYGDTGGSTFYVGARYTPPANFSDFELVAAAVFRRVLTANEIAAIVAYYNAS